MAKIKSLEWNGQEENMTSLELVKRKGWLVEDDTQSLMNDQDSVLDL